MPHSLRSAVRVRKVYGIPSTNVEITRTNLQNVNEFEEPQLAATRSQRRPTLVCAGTSAKTGETIINIALAV